VDWWDIFLGDKAAGRYVHVAVQVRSGGVFNKTCIDQRLSSEGDLRQLHSFIRVQPGSFLCYFFLFFLGYILSNFIALLFSFSFAVISSQMFVYFHLFSSACSFYFYPLHQPKCSICKSSSALKLDVVESNPKKKPP
jgi:hypothetical protein